MTVAAQQKLLSTTVAAHSKLLSTTVAAHTKKLFLENPWCEKMNSEADNGSDDFECHDIDVDEPKLGMTFDSKEEMFDYYKDYGKRKGFPVARRSSNKVADGTVRYVVFACGRYRQSKSTCSNALKPYPNGQTGCHAMIGGCLNEKGKWNVRTLNLEHNHDFVSPSKSKYLRCNREINAQARRQLVINDRAGIKVAQNYSSLVISAGGYENVAFIPRDCRNYVEKERRLRLGEGDAVALQTYFMKMQGENDKFFYSWSVDDEGRLKDIFWADARSRAAYKDFGDVITFDTTYLTNKYDMPFAPFVGVNHHGQSILLGCGLISHEDTETFTWLFRTWLACMNNVAPIGIITDQDRAMRNAIEIVFPITRHRWCLWHILKKIPEKLGSFTEYDAIRNLLHSAVSESQTTTEFEAIWLRMITEYDLGYNDWLCGLYMKRHRWVPCFLNNSFWAGMSTTQRSESMNAFFDGYVTSKTTLKQFVEQYGNALRNKVEKEVLADVKSKTQLRPCVTSFDMEKQVQDVYTLAKFKEFQQELIGKINCEFVNCVGNEFVVREHVQVADFKKRISYKVRYDKANCDVNCSCSRFQFRGILCRHAITILIWNNILVLPDKYILRRWRKDVRRCHSRVNISYDLWNSTDEQLRYDQMCSSFAEVADIAAIDSSSTEVVLEWIHTVKQELPKKSASVPRSITSTVGSVEQDIDIIRDPVVARGKGRPPSRRKQSTKFSTSRHKSKKASSSSTIKDGPINSPDVSNVISTQDSNVVMDHTCFTQGYSQQLMQGYGGFQQLLLQQYNELDTSVEQLTIEEAPKQNI